MASVANMLPKSKESSEKCNAGQFNANDYLVITE
jgi:hypothetical protein